jgi:hypothetical protein
MSPRRYRRAVAGELGPRYGYAFDGMTARAHDGVTDITGLIIDPAHLKGLTERIASLGLTLHSLTPLETANTKANSQPHTYNQPGSRMTNPGANSKGP